MLAKNLSIESEYTTSKTIFLKELSDNQIIVNSEFALHNVIVFDAFGRVLDKVSTKDTTCNIITTSYPKGLYIVYVSNEIETQTFKLRK